MDQLYFTATNFRGRIFLKRDIRQDAEQSAVWILDPESRHWIQTASFGGLQLSQLSPLSPTLRSRKKKNVSSQHQKSPGGQSLQIESLVKVSKIGGSVDKIVLEVLEDPLLADPWAFHPDC